MSKNMHGQFNHSIDAKGRLIIPAKLRDALGSEFIMSPGLEANCIYLYSEEEWDNFTEQLDHLNCAEEEMLEVQRYFNSNAIDCSIDAQGRTLVPEKLRQDAEIGKDVVVVGNGKKAEIWSAEVWNAKQIEPKEQKERIRKILRESGITFHV